MRRFTKACAAFTGLVMKRIFKALLILLVIASLPLRGLAAVDMSCAPNTHSSSGVTTDTPHHHDSAHQIHTFDDSSAWASDHCVDKGQSDGHDHLKSTTCSASVCFIGAVAPPLSLAWTARFAGSEAVVSFPPISFAGHIPAGLERPPRHHHG